MKEISSKFLDDYFKDRPQLTPPDRGVFGYEIDPRWYHVVKRLLDIAGDWPHNKPVEREERNA